MTILPETGSQFGGRQKWLTLISASASYCVANATWWTQPILIDELVRVRNLSAANAGLVVSAEMTAMAVTSWLLARILRSAGLLALGAVGIATAICFSLLSVVTSSYAGLVSERLVVGIGEGFSFLVANTAVVFFVDRDRTFANMGVVNVLFGVALVGLLPLLPDTGAAPTGFVALAIALCLLAPGVFAMPRSMRLTATAPALQSVPEQKATGGEARLRIALLCVATFVIGLASGIMWSFYGLIGEHAGLSETAVNGAIATSIFTAIVGSSLAAMLGKTFGRLIPVTLALAFMTAAIVSLSLQPGPWSFRVSTCVNVATLYFIMPYLFAAGSVQDASGRGATYVGSAFLMTGAISPYVGGVLVDTVGTAFVGGLVVVTSIVAWLLFAYVERRSVNLQAAMPVN